MLRLLYIYLLLIPVCSYGQTGNDSLVLDYKREIDKQNFLYHNLSSDENFGEVQLDYSNEHGNRKLAQEPQLTRAINFYTYGANQLGNFRISGDFLFNKIFDDSLSFGQRNNIDKWSPFNYYASKAGNYERQNYKTDLTLSYKWHKIQPFLNINYLSHWTTGSVDPRFESKKFEMKYNPGVIFHAKKSKIGLKAILGNGRENLAVSYKNGDYKQSLLYPERIHYLNMGYGYSVLKDSMILRKYSNLYGGEITLGTRIKKAIIDVIATFERLKEQSTYDLQSTKIYNIKGRYIEDRYKLKALLQLPTEKQTHHLLALEGNYTSGYDGHQAFSNDLSRKNYTVDYFEGKVSYLFTRQKSNAWNYSLGMQGTIYSIERNDYASNLEVSNSFVVLNPKLTVHHRISGKDDISLGLSPAYTMALRNALNYSPNSLNMYIQRVVFTDYNYYSSQAFSGNITAKWQTKRIATDYWTGLKISYTMEKNTAVTNPQPMGDFYPNAVRNSLSLGVYINL